MKLLSKICSFNRRVIAKHPSVKISLMLCIGTLSLFLTSCYDMTVQVSRVPINTPKGDPIYITGNFNNWDPGDSRYILRPVGDSIYEVQLPRGIGALEYKFTRGDWTTVEKDVCGYEMNNRVLVYGKQALVRDSIGSWNDKPALDCPHVVVVLDDLPGNTPEGAVLSLAGTFNGWDPTDPDWQFQYDSTLRKPILKVPRIGDDRTVSLVVTRGSLDRIESDALGNELEARRITIWEEDTIHLTVEGWADISKEKGNMVTVLVTAIPANTPAGQPIFITGEFNDWYPRDQKMRLEKNRQGLYFIHLPRRSGQFQFKFTRGGWENEEVDRWGYRIPNREAHYNQDTVRVEIYNWRDLSRPQGPPVKVVIDELPAGTPADASIHIAGNFNNWRPGDRDYVMKKDASGKYYAEIPRNELWLEFKITRGSWGSAECKPNREDIDNRRYNYCDVTEIRIKVEAWKDR